MAILSKADIVKLARLARLSLSDVEAEAFAKEISAVLGYVEQLKSADTKDLKPTNQVTGLKNVWRKDELIDYGYPPEKLLENVPEVKGGYIKVGRMIE